MAAQHVLYGRFIKGTTLSHDSREQSSSIAAENEDQDDTAAHSRGKDLYQQLQEAQSARGGALAEENSEHRYRDDDTAYTRRDKSEQRHTEEEEEDEEEVIEESQGFYCSLCDEVIQSSSMSSHAASTVHMFNRSQTDGVAKDNSIMIPRSNRGHALLNRMGWTEDSGEGLGKDRQGRLLPVPTERRPDNRGVGAKLPTNCKKRVTHTPAYVEGVNKCEPEESAANNKKPRRQKRSQNVREQEKRKERKIAREFAWDFEDQYESILRGR
eukprot:gb/GECG01010086.1/.p1 GENE.gb/GECG01010086.1/~~gb/GECG01010086.1/.p1  ORF type:complete len:269 (+),score=56.62 gb/GECG01010086.1/:1-807(+)